jgi:hypothetical protein
MTRTPEERARLRALHKRAVMPPDPEALELPRINGKRLLTRYNAHIRRETVEQAIYYGLSKYPRESPAWHYQSPRGRTYSYTPPTLYPRELAIIPVVPHPDEALKPWDEWEDLPVYFWFALHWDFKTKRPKPDTYSETARQRAA